MVRVYFTLSQLFIFALKGIPMLTLPLLLEPAQLEIHLNDPNLLLVDMRGSDSYAQGHIPGAVCLNYSDLIYSIPPVIGSLPDEKQLSAVLSAIGLTSERQVVAYDGEGGGHASRLLWTLDVLGHERFSLLNGGILAWVGEGRSVTQRILLPNPSDYQAHHINLSVVAEKNYILSRLGQADLVLLDTRSPAEYQGLDIRAARGGHIPGAVNMNWILAMDEARHWRFKSDETLRTLLESIGASPDKEVIVYCQTHHRSAHTYMVLKHLGYPRLRGYAGAWSEWGNDLTLPVER
jgi:thiosulfate/3-mercaptopyruvate sulfurtransferase